MLSNEEFIKLTERLGSLHYRLPVLNPNKEQLDRQTVLDAIYHLTLYHLRSQEAVKALSEMETRGKRLKEQIATLESKIAGNPDTTATVPAQSIGRGIDDAEKPEA